MMLIDRVRVWLDAGSARLQMWLSSVIALRLDPRKEASTQVATLQQHNRDHVSAFW